MGDLNVACFALDNHPLVFGEAVNIHPVLHPVLIKTCGVEKNYRPGDNCTLKKRFEKYTHKLGPKKVATLYLEATAKINQFWTRERASLNLWKSWGLSSPVSRFLWFQNTPTHLKSERNRELDVFFLWIVIFDEILETSLVLLLDLELVLPHPFALRTNVIYFTMIFDNPMNHPMIIQSNPMNLYLYLYLGSENGQLVSIHC